MAHYVKGDAVANATSYELFKKNSDGTYNSLATDDEINFEVSALGLAFGAHTLAVQAHADGYDSSDYSNEVEFNSTTGEETLDWLRIVNYPNMTTFEYTETTTGWTFLLAQPSTVGGGVLNITGFNADVVSSIKCNIYLFDADGNPHLHSYTTTTFNGETEPDYAEPGVGSSYGSLVADSYVQIPDGCTVMVLLTNDSNATKDEEVIGGTSYKAITTWFMNNLKVSVVH